MLLTAFTLHKITAFTHTEILLSYKPAHKKLEILVFHLHKTDETDDNTGDDYKP